MSKWKKTGSGNYILRGEGFYVSYNPNPNSCFMGISLFASDADSDETALCIQDDKQKWRILNGDFRKEYEAAFEKGVNACIEVYEANKEKKSSWSSV